MEVIFLLIAFSLLVAGGFLWAFIRSVKSGQFDDPVTPSMRILFDDTLPSESHSHHNKKEE